MEKIALFGCSRGLGFHVAENLAQNPQTELLMVSRRIEQVKWPRSQDVKRNFDFAKEESWPRIMDLLGKFNPTGIIYLGGGGPNGYYCTSDWQEQERSLNLTFKFPAFLIHQMAFKPERLKRFVVVGSQVSEDKPDPGSAMYSASKHALKGLVHSLQKEEIPFDLRLFSPSYMDTQMLAPNSWARTQNGLVQDARLLAETLIKWYGDSSQTMGHWKGL